MSEPTFAAGPWKPCGASDGKCQCGLVWSVSADTPVARAYREVPDGGGTWSPDTQAANARLIAAAPDLLAACMVAAEFDAVAQEDLGGLATIRAAIAKAVGT